MGILGAKTVQKSDVYIHILTDTLKDVIYGNTTVAGWREAIRQDLHQAFPGGGLPEPMLITPPDRQRFLMDQELNQLVEEFEDQDRQPLLEAISFFEDTIKNREERGEVWLEGMLELGIALMEAGEYERAQEVLETLVRLCESGGRLTEDMMMAA